MALVFTDEEIRQASTDVLDFPQQLELKSIQLAEAQRGKDRELSRDNANAVFYNNFKTIVDAYHTELARSEGTLRATYLTSDLEDAAKQVLNNIHYPTSPPWGNIIPKVADTNLGLPTSVAPSYEASSITNFTQAQSTLVSGFADGATSDTLFSPYSGGTVEAVNGGFSPGQRVVISQGGVDVLGIIASVGAGDPPDYQQTLTITELASSGSPGAGATITNFFGGFTNGERESGATALPATFNYFRGIVDAAGAAWESDLAAQIAAIALLSVTDSAEAAARDSALAVAQSAKLVVDGWIAAPSFGAGVGRYGDSASAPMLALASTRPGEIATRAGEIATYLGTVAQNPNGTYTASGQYGSLFRWVEFRVSKGGGSLFGFYNFDLVLAFLQNQYDQLVARKAEFDAVMRVQPLLQNTDELARSVLVQDNANLLVGDWIKILDGIVGSPVLDAQVVSIEQEAQAWRIHLADATAINYVRDNRARLVRLLA